MEISKYRKSVLEVLFVFSAIFLCYLLFEVSFVVAILFQMEWTKNTLFVSGMILLFNSSINLLVYCWRVTEIRRFSTLSWRYWKRRTSLRRINKGQSEQMITSQRANKNSKYLHLTHFKFVTKLHLLLVLHLIG